MAAATVADVVAAAAVAVADVPLSLGVFHYWTEWSFRIFMVSIRALRITKASDCESRNIVSSANTKRSCQCVLLLYLTILHKFDFPKFKLAFISVQI